MTTFVQWPLIADSLQLLQKEPAR